MIFTSYLHITVLMSLLALSFERPLAGYNYQVPDNPLVLPKRRRTTTTSKPEVGGAYNYPVPEDSLILPTKNNPSTDKKQAKKGNLALQPNTVPTDEGKRTETATKKSYDYPVPENPLTLPPRTKKPESTTSFTTITTETITETTSKLPPQNTEDGYQYPVPENPLKPGKNAVMETTETELPSQSNKDSEDGYQYPIPESPLKPSKKVVIETIEPELPSHNNDDNEDSYQYPIPENPLKPGKKAELPSQNDLKNLETKENNEGYKYPSPENPWKLHQDLPKCSSEIENEITQLMNTVGTDLLGLVEHIQQVAGNCPNQDSSDQDRNKIDLRTVNTLEGDQILDCNTRQDIQNVINTIGTDFYGLARFAQSCSQKVPEKSGVPENAKLPPCPITPVDDFSIDIRSQDEVIPGVTCMELPPCPAIATQDDFSTDSRTQDVDFIPGVTCRELPPCPLNDFAFGVIQDLTQETLIPGVNCRELPTCPPYEERNSGDISGITCKPLPPCPVNEIDDKEYELDNLPIPGVDCEDLPPCSVTEDLNSIPGLTCKILPLCPVTEISEDASKYFIPGVTCQPRPIGLENEDFQVDFSELPDFSPDYFLEESARAIDGVPAPLTTPATPLLEVVSKEQEFARFFVLEPVLVKSCREMQDDNELPNPGVNCFLEKKDIEASTDFDIEASVTVPATPLLEFAPKEQEFARVFVLEPVLVKSCREMQDENELPNPGVNCNLEKKDIEASSDLDIEGLQLALESENLQDFAVLLPISESPSPTAQDLATAVVSPVQLPLENKQKTEEKQDLGKKSARPIPLLGLDFNLATSISSSQLAIVENNFQSSSPTKKQEGAKMETQQDLLDQGRRWGFETVGANF